MLMPCVWGYVVLLMGCVLMGCVVGRWSSREGLLLGGGHGRMASCLYDQRLELHAHAQQHVCCCL